MLKTKIVSLFCVFALAVSLGIPSLAAESRQGQNTQPQERAQSRQQLWDALTDQQKKEIYSLMQKKAELDAQIIENFVKLGILDKSEADAMLSFIEQRISKMIKSGKIPFPMMPKRPAENPDKK